MQGSPPARAAGLFLCRHPAARDRGGLFYWQIPLARGTTKGAPQYGDWPDKKDSGGKETRMLEWLKEILGESYTEEIDKKVSAEIGRGFVAKVDFDAKNTELKTLKGQLTEEEEKTKF